MRINNKGFTLVEVLAVIVIIAILGFIAVPNVLSTINVGKNKSYDIMISNIVTASESLYQEVEYGGGELYKYGNDGITTYISIDENNIEVNLQTLVSNGFLEGTNNNCTTCSNKNEKILLDPRTKEDIGSCNIKITKITKKTENNVSYVVDNIDSNVKCPNTYKKEVK